MKESRLRFTTEEKLAILEEVYFMGLEPTLQKYRLTIKTLVNWQKKFKGSKAGNSMPPIKGFPEKMEITKSKPEKYVISEKEEEFLGVVASLIVQCVLKKNKPDC